MQIFQQIFNMPFVKAIQDQGGEVFAVGGCVRDYVMQKEPKDIDLIVRLLPHNVLFSVLDRQGKVDLVGESFGVFKFKTNDQEFDIALPRRDSKIEGAKGHKSIEAQSDHLMELVFDLGRRDFCFNAMAIDKDMNLIDPFNGMRDIQEKIVSCVSVEAFVEDPLRMMRAIQFAARFDFSLDYKTCALIAQHKHLIREITPERVLEEFTKVFSKKGRLQVLATYMKVLGLWEELFGVELMNKNFDLDRRLSEFLHRSVDTSKVKPSEFFKEKLKIDNDTYRELQAFEILGEAIKGIRYPSDEHYQAAYWAVFHSLKKSDVLFHSMFVSPQYTAPFKSGKFPKKMSELALTGEYFLKIGLEGKAIGDMQKKILGAIFKGDIKNDEEEIVKFIEENN